ncbi:unnamed protein product [Linum trigynum]|uniref:Uncharacterized protein n=1 Tax=Linum trigynum TaxID=586398 RepID=A0AAV2E1L4_9ROSI
MAERERVVFGSLVRFVERTEEKEEERFERRRRWWWQTRRRRRKRLGVPASLLSTTMAEMKEAEAGRMADNLVSEAARRGGGAGRSGEAALCGEKGRRDFLFWELGFVCVGGGFLGMEAGSFGAAGAEVGYLRLAA